MYSCNNNQNYFIKDNRSTSRVIQPPGGHSSFSIGGYPNSADSRNNPEILPRSRNIPLHPQSDFATNNDNTNNNINYNNAAKRNINHNQSKARDSLDNLLDKDSSCNIPGLETHYRNKPQVQQPMEPANFNESGYLQSRSSNTYAQNMTSNIFDYGVDGNSSRNNPNNNYMNKSNVVVSYPPSLQQSPRISESRYPAVTSDNRVRGVNQPPGGRSTFTIGWG